MFKKIAIAVAVATAIGSVANNAVAGSATTNLSVTATVTTNCSATTTPVAFGAYDPVGVNSASGADRLSSGGTIVVTCTKNAGKSPDPAVTIGLGLGLQPTGSTRRMVGGTNGDFLTYELYQPTATTPAAACAYTTVWNGGAGLFTPTGISGWGVSAPKTFNVCGLAVKGQDVSGTTGGESYTDTVVATITF
jgi:spore coat protein U-like protein